MGVYFNYLEYMHIYNVYIYNKTYTNVICTYLYHNITSCCRRSGNLSSILSINPLRYRAQATVHGRLQELDSNLELNHHYIM